jgi:hypothetical protein
MIWLRPACAMLACLRILGCAGGRREAVPLLLPDTVAMFKGKRKWTPRLCLSDAPKPVCQDQVGGYFKITDVIDDGHDAYLAIETDDGRRGFTDFMFVATFRDDDPAVAAQRHEQDCKRRGIPHVGMTVKQVEATCWGKPDHVNRTEGTAGVSDQFVYGEGDFVYLRNGIVTSVQMRGTLR